MKSVSVNSLASLITARQKALVPQIQQLPPPGSRPLTVAGCVAGWITARAAQALAEQPGVRLDHEATHIFAPRQPALGLNIVLSQMALVLREAGCLRGWRNELLDIYGEGRHLGVIERAAMRPLGMLTRAVHLNAWTPDGRLWIARRALSKATDPGLWDTLVGGLVGAGENLETSLLRESHEEAGLLPENLHDRSPLRMVLRMHRRLPEGYQVEDMLVSDCVLAESVQPNNLDGEVSEIRTVDLTELFHLLEAGEFTLEAEVVVLEALKRRLDQGLL